MPADSLIYLESNDLGAVMKAITERPAFREAAKTIPDFSALNGVKLAVSVTGFETKEEPISEEGSELRFTPHFVAAIETNAWNFQAVSFTENQLGEFINHVYGGEVLLETSNKNDGKYFVWKASDGRKAYALVQRSVVFFGNDESSIDKCLAVKRGEAESISKNPKITDGDRLAFGYVSPDGVAQIASISAIALAKYANDEEEVQGFIARVMPGLLRKTVQEVTWIAKISENGIVDDFSVTLDAETAKSLSSKLAVGAEASAINGEHIYEIIPTDFASITRYNLDNPENAWNGVLSVVQRNIDPATAQLVGIVAESLFDSLDIETPELFLRSVNSPILTVRIETDEPKMAVIANSNNLELTKKSVAGNFNFAIYPQTATERDVQKSRDGEHFFVFQPPAAVILGDSVAVVSCDRYGNRERPPEELVSILRNSDAASVTIGNDNEGVMKTVEVLSEKKDGENIKTRYVTETRINQKDVERRTVSDFGFIGWIITQFGRGE